MTLDPDAVNRFLEEQWAYAASEHSCVAVGDRFAVVRRAFNPATVRPGGIVSGPAQFALADLALWCACFSVIGLEAMAVTSELSIRFLRPAPSRALVARAEIEKFGRRSIVGTIRVWSEGEPDTVVSVAQGTYVRPDVRS